jgi:hypothetical protein
VRTKVEAYLAAGATKFIMRPCGPFAGWREQTEILAKEVIEPLQTPSSSNAITSKTIRIIY